MTWGSRRCAMATPGSGRNPLQGLCGPGVGVRAGAGLGWAVATNLQVCRSNNRIRRCDSLLERSGGSLHAAGQRPNPRTWRRTYCWFVGTVVVTRSSSSRSFASQAESLRHERGAFFALTPALSRSDAGSVHRTSFRGRGGYARCQRAPKTGQCTGGGRCAHPPATLGDPAGVGCGVGLEGQGDGPAQGWKSPQRRRVERNLENRPASTSQPANCSSKSEWASSWSDLVGSQTAVYTVCIPTGE